MHFNSATTQIQVDRMTALPLKFHVSYGKKSVPWLGNIFELLISYVFGLLMLQNYLLHEIAILDFQFCPRKHEIQVMWTI